MSWVLLFKLKTDHIHQEGHKPRTSFQRTAVCLSCKGSDFTVLCWENKAILIWNVFCLGNLRLLNPETKKFTSAICLSFEEKRSFTNPAIKANSLQLKIICSMYRMQLYGLRNTKFFYNPYSVLLEVSNILGRQKAACWQKGTRYHKEGLCVLIPKELLYGGNQGQSAWGSG